MIEREPDEKRSNEEFAEMKLISGLTEIEDRKNAEQLGMTIEEYYRERDEMHDDSWITKNAESGIF